MGLFHILPKARIDTWYYIEPDSPYFQAGYYRRDNSNSFYIMPMEYQVGYYQNDQTFIEARYLTNHLSSSTYIYGSYLFDCGLFLGLNNGYFKYDSESTEYYQISPGYRWNFDDNNSYIALSLDYINHNSIGYQSGIKSWELETKYYMDTMKLSGQILKVRNSFTYFNLHCTFKITDQLVTAAGLSYQDELNKNITMINTGLTYDTDSYIIDALIRKPNSPEDMYTSLSFMFQLLNDFYMGIGASKLGSEDANLSLKTRYRVENTQFILVYDLKNDSQSASTSLYYQYAF